MDDNRPSRIVAFDHVRGIAVICMIISHVTLMFGTDIANGTIVGRFMNDWCGRAPAAPVFMMLMGVFFSYPRDKPMFTKVLRGAKIFLLGILLNIARFVIPMSIASIFLSDLASGARVQLNLSVGEAFWRMFYNMDILEFAGVAFVILALLQRFIKRSFIWVIVGAVVVFVAPYLWGTGEDWGIYYNLVQPLWGDSFSPNVPGDTSFPVFPWLVYPIAGILIGKALSSGMEQHALFKRMLFSGIGLLAFGAVIVIIKTSEQFGDYWRMFPGGTSMVLGFALVWTAFFMWLERAGLFQKALSTLNFWSVNITLAYCVQWVLLGFATLALGYKLIDNEWFLLALAPVFIVVSYFITVILLRRDGFMRSFRWFTK